MPLKFFNERRRVTPGVTNHFKISLLFARKCHFISRRCVSLSLNAVENFVNSGSHKSVRPFYFSVRCVSTGDLQWNNVRV